MGDLEAALAGLLGKDAPNMAPSVIARRRDARQADDERFQQRDLSARHNVYLLANRV